MNFFKGLFSSGKGKTETNQQKVAVEAVYTDEYFKDRYTEQNINDKPMILDGCLKMIGGYFLANKIQQKIAEPVNHPVNLDQVVVDGMGFHTYCQALQLEDGAIITTLAYAFGAFLINSHGFKLYKDSKPEVPLRSMTLKYDKNGIVLSIYPFEYALKVLDRESAFEVLYNKITNQIATMPDKETLLKTSLTR
jgi:hypothetical protein